MKTSKIGQFLIIHLCMFGIADLAYGQYNLRGTPYAQGSVIHTSTELDVQTMRQRRGEDQIEIVHVNGKGQTELEIIETIDGDPSRLQLNIVTQHMSEEKSLKIGDEPIKTASDGPLAGKTVEIERTDGTWTKRLLGGDPTPLQQRFLDEPYIDHATIYPDRVLSVGESWQITDTRILDQFALGTTGFSAISAMATYKYQGILDKDDPQEFLTDTYFAQFLNLTFQEDEQYAIITFTANFVGTFGGSEFTLEGYGTLYRSLATFVDSSMAFAEISITGAGGKEIQTLQMMRKQHLSRHSFDDVGYTLIDGNAADSSCEAECLKGCAKEVKAIFNDCELQILGMEMNKIDGATIASFRNQCFQHVANDVHPACARKCRAECRR